MKAEARKAAFARRKVAHAQGRGAADAARGHLLEAWADHPQGVVAGYMPIRTELDPLSTMAALEALGHQICLPVIQGAGRPLVFHAWTSGGSLKDGPFGVRVPVEAVVLEPDLLIVPLVAFDKEANRLGYGGGFYDRTLERLRAKGSVRALGFAYAGQMSPEPLPLEPMDQSLDGVITETGLVGRARRA